MKTAREMANKLCGLISERGHLSLPVVIELLRATQLDALQSAKGTTASDIETLIGEHMLRGNDQ